MTDDRDSATRYRERAEELRTIAESTKDRAARDALLAVANDYMHMAEARERQRG